MKEIKAGQLWAAKSTQGVFYLVIKTTFSDVTLLGIYGESHSAQLLHFSNDCFYRSGVTLVA